MRKSLRWYRLRHYWMMKQNLYTSGEYQKKNPTWHTEDSFWKATKIFNLLNRNALFPKSVCEIGCGGGEILIELQKLMDNNCNFYGYEISPQAFEICERKSNDHLSFYLSDFLKDEKPDFDILLMIDLIEHIEDYHSFLRHVKNKGTYKVFHIPLDIFICSLIMESSILELRENVGHIHYFTKNIALKMLEDLNYEIIDYCYTRSFELGEPSLKSNIVYVPRKIVSHVCPDIGQRVFGGHSLLVLSK